MNGKERLAACLAGRPPDRLPVKYEAVAPITTALMQRLGVETNEELLTAIGVDYRFVDPRYCGPEWPATPEGYVRGLWGEVCSSRHNDQGVFQDPVHLPYADVAHVRELDKRTFPTADWYDYSDVRSQCEKLTAHAAVTGNPGHMDFLNGIGRCRGQAQVLMDVATESPVFLELVERRFRFYYELLRRTLEAADGRIDLVWAGEDLGTQQGLMISPGSFDKLFAEKYAAYFGLAHRHGAKTILHSCGAVRPLIPRLIELGLDVLDVVQVSCPGMALEELQREFGGRLCFCGSICVQKLLPQGTPDDVRHEVRRRRQMFRDGGLILGPSNTIQIGTPLENILAMYDVHPANRVRPTSAPD